MTGSKHASRHNPSHMRTLRTMGIGIAALIGLATVFMLTGIWGVVGLVVVGVVFEQARKL